MRMQMQMQIQMQMQMQMQIQMLLSDVRMRVQYKTVEFASFQGLLQKCSICDDSNVTTSHPPSYMTDYRVTQSDGTTAVADLSTWWQSVTWYQLGRRPVIDVTLSFGKLYQLLDDLVIVFQSGRPKQMILEKSMDFGQTWSTLQYFNRTCKLVADC
jgi:Laminin N-terminal (Domain VI)